MFLSEEAGVRKQDGYKIIVSNTMVGRLVGWEWVRSHWDQLTEYYDPALSVYIGPPAGPAGDVRDGAPGGAGHSHSRRRDGGRE